jgi:ribosomal protein L28
MFLVRFYDTTSNRYIMKALIFKIPLISLLFLASYSFGQKNRTWNQVKSAELTQPFGYVWNYVNSPNPIPKPCKGHSHKNHKTAEYTSPNLLKKSFLVEKSFFKIKLTNVSTIVNSKTTVFYLLLDNKGNELKGKTYIVLENTLEKQWSKKNIDLSTYEGQTVTIAIGIDKQEENSSLFINLFQ